MHVSSFAVGVEHVGNFGGHLTNSIVDGNEIGLVTKNGFRDVSSNTIENNTNEGIVCLSCGTSFTNNTILQNGSDGILILDAPAADTGEQIGEMKLSARILLVSDDQSSDSPVATFRHNSVELNSGASVRIESRAGAPPDFGTQSSPGKNSFRKNKKRFTNASRFAVSAEGNYWDHASLSEIEANDIAKDGTSPVIVDPSQEENQI